MKRWMIPMLAAVLLISIGAAVLTGLQSAPASVETPTPVTTEAPTEMPAETPAEAPTQIPTEAPTEAPTQIPTEAPTEAPTQIPTEAPTEAPTQIPTEVPTEAPTEIPTEVPAPAETASAGPDLSWPKMRLISVTPAEPLAGTQPFVVRGSLGDKWVLEDEEGVYSQCAGFEEEYDFRLAEGCDVRVPADFYGDPESVPCDDLLKWAQDCERGSGYGPDFMTDVTFDENGHIVRLHYHYYHDQ